MRKLFTAIKLHGPDVTLRKEGAGSISTMVSPLKAKTKVPKVGITGVTDPKEEEKHDSHLPPDHDDAFSGLGVDSNYE